MSICLPAAVENTEKLPINRIKPDIQCGLSGFLLRKMTRSEYIRGYSRHIRKTQQHIREKIILSAKN
jgi:hypothetical protein